MRAGQEVCAAGMNGKKSDITGRSSECCRGTRHTGSFRNRAAAASIDRQHQQRILTRLDTPPPPTRGRSTRVCPTNVGSAEAVLVYAGDALHHRAGERGGDAYPPAKTPEGPHSLARLPGSDCSTTLARHVYQAGSRVGAVRRGCTSSDQPRARRIAGRTRMITTGLARTLLRTGAPGSDTPWARSACSSSSPRSAWST